MSPDRLEDASWPHRIARARRILIVRLSSVGDVIHTLPLLSALRDVAPEADIRWLVQSSIAPLLEPAVKTLRFERSRPWRSLIPLRRALRQFAPEVTLDLQGNTKSGFLAALSGAKCRIGLDAGDCREWTNALFTHETLPRLASRHAVERTLEIARWIGSSGAPDFDFAWTDAELSRARADLESLGVQPDRPTVLLNAGRTSDVRSWPFDHQVRLVHTLADRGCLVLVQGGPAENQDAESWRARTEEHPRVRLAAGRFSLRELGAIYRVLSRQPHLVVGSDSGPLHLAAASGARTLGLYGPQDPSRTGPYGPNARVLLAAGDYECRPCLRRRCHFERPLACLRELSVERVAREVEARLQRD